MTKQEFSLMYHCVRCDQDFAPDDKITRCPNAASGSHAIIEVRRAIGTTEPTAKGSVKQ